MTTTDTPRRAVLIDGATRVACAVALGLVTSASYQPLNLWFLAPLCVAGLCLLVRGQRLVTAAVLGFVFALAMWWSGITWLAVIDPAAPGALAVIQSLWFIPLTMTMSAVQSRNDRPAVPGWPLLAAAAWMAAEYGYSRWPWGGFGWFRLGFTSVDAPWGGLLPLVGVAGAGFFIAVMGTFLAWLATQWRRRLVAAAVATALLAVTIAGGFVRWWLPAETPTSSVNVGIVQGNVFGVGINAMGRARSMPNNHLDETVRMLAAVRAKQLPTPDIVVWPESSADADPRSNDRTRETFDTAAQLADAPLLAGTTMRDPRTTTVVWWDPRRGMTGRYDKQNLVPFGEWIPLRDTLLPLLPVLHNVGDQSVPGTGPGILSGTIRDGRTLVVGDLICYELEYDDTVTEMLAHNPQIIVAQSNNAPYGWGSQNAQQLAITRARAMEGRREIAVSTTSGISGLIGQRGEVLDPTPEFVSDHRVYPLPIRTTQTPAVTLAIPLSRLVAAVGALAAVGSWVWLLVWRRRAGTVGE